MMTTFCKYSFQILHFNRMKRSTEAEVIIEKRILSLLKDFFADNSLEPVYEALIKMNEY